MGEFIVGAVAAILIGAAGATGATYAMVALSAPDDSVQFSPTAPVNNTAGLVDYGTP